MSAIDLNFESRAIRDRAYNARESVPDFDACMARYHASAQAVRRRAQTERQRTDGREPAENHEDSVGSLAFLDLQYGQGIDERLDLYLPVSGAEHLSECPPESDSKPVPVLVFIHGGYWRAQRKEDACIMAPMLNAAGVALCCIEYTLMPEATMGEIVREARSAIAWLHANGSRYGVDPDRIHICGSSAGGQLVGVLLEDQWQQRFKVPQDVIKGALALSGLFDIRPLCDTIVNDWMQLTEAQASRYSPMLNLPHHAPPILLAVGGLEPDGFKRQTEAYRLALETQGLSVAVVDTPHNNHFDLLCELETPNSALSQALLAQIKA